MAASMKKTLADATNLVLRSGGEVLTLIDRMGLEVNSEGELVQKHRIFKYDDRKLSPDERKKEWELIAAIDRVRLNTAIVNEARTHIIESTNIVAEHTAKLRDYKSGIISQCEALNQSIDEFKATQDKVSEFFKGAVRQFKRPIASLKNNSGPVVKEFDMKKNEKVAAKPEKTEKAAGKETVEELMAKLKKATDKVEKRNLRARLRTLGHSGGLGIRAAEMKNEGIPGSKKKVERIPAPKKTDKTSKPDKVKKGKRSSK